MITVYLKATNFCNVGCSHCYLTEESRANKNKMSEDTLKNVGSMLNDWAKKDGHREINIIWHGGEPLVLKKEFYQSAQKILTEIIEQKVIFSLQSSLIPLTEDHLNWIKDDLGGGVGTSMDFSARAIKGSNEDYQKLFMKKVDLCRENGIKVIPGVTPSKMEMKKAKEIVQWMLDHGFDEFNIERYNTFGFNPVGRIKNNDFSLFLIDLFESVMNQEKKPKVRVIKAVLSGIVNGVPGDRWGGSCQSDFVVIEPDGSLNNCPDKATREDPYSNVSNGVEGWIESKSRRKWIRVQTIGHRESHCLSCENNTWCKSGCPITSNKLEIEGDCSGYKNFINFVRKWMENDENKKIGMNYLVGD